MDVTLCHLDTRLNSPEREALQKEQLNSICRCCQGTVEEGCLDNFRRARYLLSLLLAWVPTLHTYLVDLIRNAANLLGVFCLGRRLGCSQVVFVLASVPEIVGSIGAVRNAREGEIDKEQANVLSDDTVPVHVGSPIPYGSTCPT